MAGFMNFEDDDKVDNIDIVDDNDTSEDTEDGEELLRKAVEAYQAAADEEDYDDEDDSDDEQEEDQSEEVEDTDTQEDESETSKQDFKNAENAQNAERRRQAEQRKLEEFRAQTPEYQIISNLAQARGVTPEQMLQEVQEALLVQQSQERQVPVEVLREMQAQNQKLQLLETQVAMREYQEWDNRINNEAKELKTSFPFLTDDDISKSKDLLLNTWQNVEAPLEQAVFALHGRKIAQMQQEASRNDVLAEVSGRKAKSVVPPKSGKAATVDTLTEDERYIASMMGISEAEYTKNKLRR